MVSHRGAGPAGRSAPVGPAPSGPDPVEWENLARAGYRTSSTPYRWRDIASQQSGGALQERRPEMAGYMVFIWDDEAAWANADPHTVESTMAAHEDFMARNAAVLRGGSRLHT